MTTHTLDAQIGQQEMELQRYVTRMENLVQEFVPATAKFLREFYDSQATSIVTGEQAQLTQELAQNERLSGLRGELQDLQESARSAVEEFLGNDRLWWHRNPEHPVPPDPSPGTRYSSTGGGLLSEAIRILAGRLVPVLEKYGYAMPSAEWGSRTTTEHAVDPHVPAPIYRIGLSWSERMNTLIVTYQQVFSQAITTVRTLRALEAKRDSALASDLWKEA